MAQFVREAWLSIAEKGGSVLPKSSLKNSRSINSLLANTDSDAFCCSKSIERLKEEGHTGALNWIIKIIRNINKFGKPLPQVLKRANIYWYKMKDDGVADLVTGMNPDKRLFVARFEQPSFINQRLIGLRSKRDSVDIELCHALLNSMVGMYFIEALGFGRGLGVLDINNNSLKKMMMLNPDKISDSSKTEILEHFQLLLDRATLSTDEELNMNDRQAFDMAVLRAYGIEGKYEVIKSSLRAMQTARLAVV